MTSREVFTSKLDIDSSNEALEKVLVERAEIAELLIDSIFNKFNQYSVVNKMKNKFNIEPFLNGCESVSSIISILSKYNTFCGNEVPDLTGCLKGLFMFYMFKDLEDENLRDPNVKFYINFGGDIYGRGGYEIGLEDSSFKISTPFYHTWACFTSGNFGKREKHIKMLINEPEKFKLLTVYGPRAKYTALPFMDILATYAYSTNQVNIEQVRHALIGVDFENKVLIGGANA